jgi:exonuclease III
VVILFSVSMDSAHILFWNVQGLNSPSRQMLVMNLVSSMNIDVVCIQESKMSKCSRRAILSIMGIDFDNNFICLLAVGVSGGIILAEL